MEPNTLRPSARIGRQFDRPVGLAVFQRQRHPRRLHEAAGVEGLRRDDGGCLAGTAPCRGGIAEHRHRDEVCPRIVVAKAPNVGARRARGHHGSAAAIRGAAVADEGPALHATPVNGHALDRGDILWMDARLGLRPIEHGVGIIERRMGLAERLCRRGRRGSSGRRDAKAKHERRRDPPPRRRGWGPCAAWSRGRGT
jgi:hypothetical protein